MNPRVSKIRVLGFTLLEVAFVVAIGIVLIGVAASAYGQYRDGARIQAAKMELGALRSNISGYRLRKGAWPPFGIAIAANAAAAAATTITLKSGLPAGEDLVNGSILCLGSVKATLSVDPAVGATSLTVASLPAAVADNTVARVGLAGNVDDLCNNLLNRSYTGASVDGMGLSDPWIGYQKVRNCQVPLNLPVYTTAGFTFDNTAYLNNSQQWGGLVYNPGPTACSGGLLVAGDLQYVLPDPGPAGQPPPPQRPPAAVGYFPNDPPVNWGR